MKEAKKKNVKTFLVNVGVTGGEVKIFDVQTGTTVEDALDKAGLDYDEDSRIRVNGAQAELEDELEEGDIVTVAGNIRGG